MSSNSCKKDKILNQDLCQNEAATINQLNFAQATSSCDNYTNTEEENTEEDSDCSDQSEIIDLEKDGSIPYNYIHKKLCYNEREFRKVFYAKYINYIESFKKNKDKKIVKKIAGYIKTLREGVNGQNIKDYQCDSKLKNLGLIMLPNFAVASLSYIPNEADKKKKKKGKKRKGHTKNLRFSPTEGHTEEQILDYINSKKLNKEKYKNAKKVVIDIHSKLSSCMRCQEKLKEFARKNHKKIEIRQSFDLLFTTNVNYKPLNICGVKEKECDFKLSDKNLLQNENSFLVSGGGSDKVKQIIKEVKNDLTKKDIDDKDINKLGTDLIKMSVSGDGKQPKRNSSNDGRKT